MASSALAARSTACCTSAATGANGPSPHQPILSSPSGPLTSISGGATRRAYGSVPSAPASSRSARAESRTVLVSGPTCMYRSSTSGQWPVSGIRPWVAFNPTRPQWLAGCRIDPPTSLPMPRGDIPLATAAASPPLEPPVVRVSSHGFLVVPKMRLPVSHQRANSGRFVFAIITPPASRRRVTTVASLSGTLSANMSEPPVVLMPAVSMQSLTVNGNAVERSPRLAPHRWRPRPAGRAPSPRRSWSRSRSAWG